MRLDLKDFGLLGTGNITTKVQQYLPRSKIGVDVKSTTLLAQTRTGLEPLVKLLRKNKLDISILDKLCKIIDCIETMDYRGAHDTYVSVNF